MIYLGDIVEKLEYPGTKFHAIQFADPQKLDKVFLLADCASPDNFDPAKSFTVQRGREVDAYYQSEMEGIQVVRALLHYVACHEVDEQLKCGGSVIFNPHSTFQRSELP